MMSRRNIWLSAIVLVLALYGEARAQESFTIDQAMAYAMENEAQVLKAYLNIRDAESQIKETRAIGYPKLNINADYQRALELPTSILPGEFQPRVDVRELQDVAGENFLLGVTRLDENGVPVPGDPLAVQFGTRHNLNLTANFEMLLFEGSYIVGLQTAKLYKDFASSQLEEVKYSIKQNVAKAFYNVLMVEETMTAVAKDIANAQKAVEETQKIYEAGFIEELDVDRLRLSLKNLQIQMSSLEQLLVVNKNNLKITMGYPLDKDISTIGNIESTIGEIDVMDPDYYSSSFTYSDRPDYEVALQNRSILSQNVKRYRYQYFPTLSLYGVHSQSLQGNSFAEASFFPATIAGLKLAVPIYDGRDKKSKIERAKIALDMADIDITQLQRTINVSIQNSVSYLRNSSNTYDLAVDNMELAEDIYRKAMIKYKEGVGSSVELRLAESDYYMAQNQWIQKKYDLINAKIDLDKVLGKL